jgi:hypothetical protein
MVMKTYSGKRSKISKTLVQDEFGQFHAEDDLLLTVQVHSFACV